jgi:low affinity Fe/Cu permease
VRRIGILSLLLIILLVAALIWAYILEPIFSWSSQNILYIGLAVCLILLLFIWLHLYRRKKSAEQQRQEQRRIEKERVKRQEFEARQRAIGLEKYTAFNGVEKWGSASEIAGWKKADKEIAEKESLFNQIVKDIKNFKPLERYPLEEGYHNGLYYHLASKYPNIRHEHQEEASRPDITIGNNAIEVKGPTYNKDIDDLIGKVRYSEHWDRAIFVLFDPQYTDAHFNEVKNTIKRLWPESEFIIIPVEE